MNKTVRCIVAGKVQGVSFRAYTRREAQRLNLRGWARNLPDGSVEVVAGGEGGEVDALCGWLWEGSPYASVTQVECFPAEEELPPHFHVL